MVKKIIKKKILILKGYPGNLGGIVNLYNLLYNELNNSKYQIEHYTIGRNQKNKFESYFIISLIFEIFRLIKYIFFSFKNDFNLILLNTSLEGKSLIRDFFYFIVTKSLYNNSKIITFLHGWDVKLEEKLYKKNIINTFFYIIINNSHHLIVLSKAFKKRLTKLGIINNKISVFYNAVDIPNFEKIIKTPILAQNSTIKLLFMSRIVKEKGIFELLESFKFINEERGYTNIELLITGDGPDIVKFNKYLEKLEVRNKIKNLGYLRNNDKYYIMLQSNIFVFPTYYPEGLPVVILEALAAGLPIITTKVGGIPDILEEGKNALFVEPKNINSLTNAIIELISNKNLRKSMSKNNREKAKEFDVRISIKKLEKIFDKVIEK